MKTPHLISFCITGFTILFAKIFLFIFSLDSVVFQLLGSGCTFSIRFSQCKFLPIYLLFLHREPPLQPQINGNVSQVILQKIKDLFSYFLIQPPIYHLFPSLSHILLVKTTTTTYIYVYNVFLALNIYIIYINIYILIYFIYIYILRAKMT